MKKPWQALRINLLYDASPSPVISHCTPGVSRGHIAAAPTHGTRGRHRQCFFLRPLMRISSTIQHPNVNATMYPMKPTIGMPNTTGLIPA